jgi:hypothetical protein
MRSAPARSAIRAVQSAVREALEGVQAITVRERSAVKQVD